MTRKTNHYFTLRWWRLCLALACAIPAACAPAADLITNAVEVLALPAEEASRAIPVVLKGVVTAAEPNWAGRFFVQDASGGVFINNVNGVSPAVGDLVAVSGVSFPGGYAPCVTKPRWEKLGTAAVPAARPVSIERLMSGAEDSQRIEISGMVRAAWTNSDRLGIELVSGGFRLRAFAPIPPDVHPESLLGARTRLRGTAATSFNAPLRHFITVTLFVPRLADFIIEQPAPADPFNKPLMPLNDIAQYRRDRPPGNQVHVKGVVTYQRKGEDLFLQDPTGGLQVKSRMTDPVAPGDVVEAVGFPAIENYLPVLEDAIFRKVDEPRVRLAPKAVTVGDLQEGLHHADLISLEGRLIDRWTRSLSKGGTNPAILTTLVLQTTNFIFVAEKETAKPNRLLASVPIGSLVEATGICLLESTEDGKIKSLRVLLPASHDVRILERPSWLTPRHLLISLGAVLTVLLVAISWTLMLSKKNSILKLLVREKESAQAELQKAHDQLEERVKERTAQLKVEMTGRKESELQFRAVLTERTRLAQELHDTLEQTMTGIALQLNMVANHFEKNPADAFHHLKLARNLMRQSQVYLRDSVRGLRSRSEEQFNLTNALISSSRQIAGSAGIRVEVATAGEGSLLSEIAEENLLRIGQEAVTNVVKHSGAGTVRIDLQFSPQKVMLRVADDGKGFVPENCAGPKEGHFGLLGIRERVERLGGKVVILSSPGKGACVQVEIPVNASNGKESLQPANAHHEERT